MLFKDRPVQPSEEVKDATDVPYRANVVQQTPFKGGNPARVGSIDISSIQAVSPSNTINAAYLAKGKGHSPAPSMRNKVGTVDTRCLQGIQPTNTTASCYSVKSGRK